MIVLRIFVLLLPLVSAVIIDCGFQYETNFIGQIYHCILASDAKITSPGMRVTAATGERDSSKTNADILGFLSWGSSHTINYIPQGLDAVFPNLIAIAISDGRIKELHQSDLQNYTKLQLLNFSYNDIAFLEEDLFKHNTQLKFIDLRENKIAEIHPNVFDHLTQLTGLWLLSNFCIDSHAYINRTEVLNLIEDVKGKCVPGPLLLAN